MDRRAHLGAEALIEDRLELGQRNRRADRRCENDYRTFARGRSPRSSCARPMKTTVERAPNAAKSHDSGSSAIGDLRLRREATAPTRRGVARICSHIVVVAVAALISPGCAGLNPYKVAERSIGSYLASKVGPADHYHVHIRRNGARLASGYLSQVAVSADHLQTVGGLEIDHFDSDLAGVTFDRGTRRLTHIASSSFTASVTTQNANAYLAAHDHGVPGLAV